MNGHDAIALSRSINIQTGTLVTLAIPQSYPSARQSMMVVTSAATIVAPLAAEMIRLDIQPIPVRWR